MTARSTAEIRARRNEIFRRTDVASPRMKVPLRIKRVARTALNVFASTGNTQFAGVVIFTLLGLIVSFLIAIPGEAGSAPRLIQPWFASDSE
jgi:hypothetical protein